VDSAHAIYRPSSSGSVQALRQGELLTGLVQAILDVEFIGKEEDRIDRKIHPYAIILTQDCDLEQDFKARSERNKLDKLIPSVLFCEAVTAEALRGSAGITTDIWKRIRINKDERYQFLQRIGSVQDAAGQDLPELGIDFKRYFTIPADEVYRRIELGEARRRCVLSSPYLEHFCCRFAYYLSRVALPLDHLSE
jgi:hypothetical protein